MTKLICGRHYQFPLGFHDETDNVARIPTRKAFVEAFVRRNEEGRGLFAIEWTQAFKIGASSLERYFPGDNIENTDAIFDIANTARLDGWHAGFSLETSGD